MSTITVSGPVRVWSINGHSRAFSEFTVPFRDAVRVTMPFRFNAATGKGEQRGIEAPHMRKLARVMMAGEFTPTPAAAALTARQRQAVRYEDGGRRFTLEVDESDPLPLTDAGHRLEAIASIRKDALAKLAVAKTDEERARYQKLADDADALPIPFVVHLDGDSQRDFLNLQAGRAVDSSQMYSMAAHQGLLGDPARVAKDVGQHLHRLDDSPFKNSIKFDTRGVGALGIKTLAATGASDLATSLVGLARVGAGLDPEQLAGFVTAAHTALRRGAPGLLAYGKVLTPVSENGNRGSATMLTGLAVCLAHRAVSQGKDAADDGLLAELVAAASATLDEPVNGGFSSATKRQLMGRFARAFFAPVECDKHEGIPVSLLKALAPSAFGVPPIPKARPAAAAQSAPEADEAEVSDETFGAACGVAAEPILAA